MRPLHVADDVHGASGLEGADLPEPAFEARPEGAIELLRAVLAAAPEPVTIAAVGPLTNIALLVRTHPELLERIASIRVMGGAITEGNTTASAEFNIWQDPEAARIVFDCGRPVTLMTLDTTHQALFTAGRRRAAGAPRHPGRPRVFADLLRYLRPVPRPALRLGRVADPRRGDGRAPRRAGSGPDACRTGSTWRRPAS